MNNKLSQAEKDTLLKIAREALKRAVALGEIYEPPPPESENLLEPRGCFVTLKKHDMLRGCIGYIEPIKPLYQAVAEMAYSAAMRDPRFPPVSMNELGDITIEISVLSPLRKIDNIEEIEVGRHGLFIKKGFYSGLLLPQVATEYGWDKYEFLRQTCYKAGLSPDDYKKGADIYIFEAEVFSEEEKSED